MNGAIRSAIAEMKGARKSAILCLALGPDDAVKLLQQLSPAEVEAVSREIAALRDVPPEVVDAVLNDFYEASSGRPPARGGLDFAKQLLEQTIGPVQAKRTIEKIQKQPNAKLPRLESATPEVLSDVLQGEHPQTIALVLAHIDAGQAAQVVQRLEPALGADVLYRIARMGTVSPQVLADVEAELAGKSDVSLSSQSTVSGGPAAVASLLNATSGELDQQLLEAISGRSVEAAEEIRHLMFVFEDILLLDGRGVQRLLREVDTKELALALKAASDELKAHIMDNMSGRAADALREEIEFMGAVRVRDVEEAHQRIIAHVRTLEESGEVVVSGRGGDDDVLQ